MDDRIPVLVWRHNAGASAHNRRFGGRCPAWTLYAFDGNWQRQLQTVYSNSNPGYHAARQCWQRQAHLWERSRRRANAIAADGSDARELEPVR